MSDTNSYITPIQYPITIPRPMHINYRKGLLSLNHAYPVTLRIQPDDLNLIREEAKLIDAEGISTGAFIRWCAIYTAQRLRYERTAELVEVNP